jgi:hypothetical protein
MHHAIGAGFGLLFVLFLVALGILAFIFWILMLVNAITNSRLNGTEKIVWVLVIIFLHFLGALIYFLVGRRQT